VIHRREVGSSKLEADSSVFRAQFIKWRCHVERSETSLLGSLTRPSRFDPRFFSRDCGIRMTP